MPDGTTWRAVSSMDVFAARLDLLASAGEITVTARRLTDDVVDEIVREFELDLDEEHGAQLVTHLAMALARLDRGDAEVTALPVVEDELADCKREHDFARRVLDRCGAELGRPVPEGEVAYLAVHLCALSG